jgi:hypothetical protein
MIEATSPRFYERQRLAMLETALASRAGPPSGEQLSWYNPSAQEQVRGARRRLPWT